MERNEDALFPTISPPVATKGFKQMPIYITSVITGQRDATQSGLFIILQVHCTCFGCQPHPSSGVHKTVTTASGTCAAASLQRGQLGHFGER